jgi:hypothetical protein
MGAIIVVVADRSHSNQLADVFQQTTSTTVADFPLPLTGIAKLKSEAVNPSSHRAIVNLQTLQTCLMVGARLERD